MERELEIAILENSGSASQGGEVELTASGPFEINDIEMLITIALLTLLTILFGLSRTGKVFFDRVDNIGSARVESAGGGGGAEFTIENR